MSYTFGEAASVYRRDATTQTEDCNVGPSQPKNCTSIDRDMVSLVVEALCGMRKPKPCVEDTVKGTDEHKINKEPEIDDDDTVTVMHSGPSAESCNRKRGACCKGSVEQRAPKRRRKEY
jgi:hypothetical protein